MITTMKCASSHTRHARGRAARRGFFSVGASLVLGAGFLTSSALFSTVMAATPTTTQTASAPSAASATPEQIQIARGAYLATASDCIACHTATKGKPYGGGYPIATPFGKIYGSNISSDMQYGIGSWSDQQFLAAVRDGVGGDGQNLYPAMPYDSFTKMKSEDVLAIKAYLMSLPPVHTPTPKNTLPFPFNQRWTMVFWKLINVDKGELKDDPAHNAEWNRGRYMVEALAHCEACHTPRNITFGMSGSRAFGGGDLGAWTAYNITPDKGAGIGSWSDAELVQYLHSGDAPGRASAAGPMGEAVEHSLQYLKEDDLKAMVAYLRTVPAQTGPSDANNRSRQGKPATDYAALRGADANYKAAHMGADLFLTHCATCHAATGAGAGQGPSAYPSLFDHSAVGDHSTRNLVSVILNGVKRDMKTGAVYMPSFATDMSDEQIATLTNYLTGQFGNPGSHTTADQVKKLRTVDLKPFPDLDQDR